MTQKAYKIIRGSLHDQFANCRAKGQLFGGGFANGKTTAGVVTKALKLAKDYPGSNGLIARATYPKLNDTIRKVFFEWCPPHWIDGFDKANNIVTMENGTVVNFRYIAQTGKNSESSTSNLLSATYDWIIVDQLEDPEITYKDFLDLLGRLRGNARYIGDDPTMPLTGPRWFVGLFNPTANWVYKELIKPILDHQAGVKNEKLILNPRTGEPMFELFTGSTYENAHNLARDYIETLESTYKGQQRDRYLLGKYASYEGLVYPEFDSQKHVVPHEDAVQYYYDLIARGFIPTILEGFDFGMIVPSCYLLAFVDPSGNIIVLDGFYEPELGDDEIASRIHALRKQYELVINRSRDGDDRYWIKADPSIFRRAGTVGPSLAARLQEYGIWCERGNNDIADGITKVRSYLTVRPLHLNPFTGNHGAPYLFFSDNVPFVQDEFLTYMWKKDPTNNEIDKPKDKDDHAMDTLKYMLSKVPQAAIIVEKPPVIQEVLLQWRDKDEQPVDTRAHRYG